MILNEMDLEDVFWLVDEVAQRTLHWYPENLSIYLKMTKSKYWNHESQRKDPPRMNLDKWINLGEVKLKMVEKDQKDSYIRGHV